MLYKQVHKNVIVLAILFVTVVQGQPDGNTANKYFLEKQKFLFEIVHNLQNPLEYNEWIYMGTNLVIEKSNYIDFNNLMKKYLIKINTSALLPLNEISILADETHLEELKGLYYFLYNAKDFETLKQNICWARYHVQAQMFVFALTQVMIKRGDFSHLNLPKIYEIWPQHFLAEKYIRNLQRFNYVQWSKTDMYQNYYKASNVAREMSCRGVQWCCKRNLQFKIYEERESIILPRTIYGNLRNSSKRLQALEDVTFYWLPVGFSRELNGKRELTGRSVTYLTDDISWNAYWYYINMGLWLNERGQNDLYSKTVRDWWFWNLQQIVVRYKMEAGTTAIPRIDSDPFLINYQGLKYKTINKKSSEGIRSFINDLFAKTQIALNEQKYELENKTMLHLNNSENFEYFLNEHFAIEKVLKAFMSATNKQYEATVLQYFETMLRSKEFYYYAELIINLYKSLKANFESYKPQDLQSDGVTINDVEVSELQTYFELVDTDVTNLLQPSNFYFEGNFLWFKSLLARQPSLQHQPFKYVFNLTADKPQAVLVRTFLARDCSVVGCSASTELFQLDTFVSTLANGHNSIERESKDFHGYMLPSLSYTELYHFTRLALNEKYEYPLNINSGNCRFPHHLKLPKGVEGQGLPVKFVFVATTYNYRFHKASNFECDFSSGILAFDNFPPGFPFDSEVSDSVSKRDNVLIKKSKVYHDDNY